MPPRLNSTESKGAIVMSLSDMQCKTAKPRSSSYKLFDGEGLYLEVKPSSAKHWRMKYRFDGKEKRISFGMYPNVSLLQARANKSAAKEILRAGSDPVLKRKQQKRVDSVAAQLLFEEVASEWHQKQLGVWKARHAATVLHRLEKYVFPDLGKCPINSIKPLMVLDCIQKIDHTAPEMARRVLRYCHHVFLLAIVTERLDQDPTNGLVHALRKYKKSHFASIDLDVLPQFLFDLHEYKFRLSRQTFLAIRLMFLTFIRTSELIQAKWDEISFENAMWTIPAERMKMGRPHLVPLSRQALAVLDELRKMNGNKEYIFPGISKINKQMSDGTILVALSRMGYRNKMTGHGFRALAMGIIKEKLGYSHELVDRQLAHAPKSNNDRAYDRALFLPQRTEMMQAYGNYLDTVYLKFIQSKLT